MKIIIPLYLISNKIGRKESMLTKKSILFLFILIRANFSEELTCSFPWTVSEEETSDASNSEMTNLKEEQKLWKTLADAFTKYKNINKHNQQSKSIEEIIEMIEKNDPSSVPFRKSYLCKRSNPGSNDKAIPLVEPSMKLLLMLNQK